MNRYGSAAETCADDDDGARRRVRAWRARAAGEWRDRTLGSNQGLKCVHAIALRVVSPSGELRDFAVTGQ